jgi:hypothetical protein
MVVSITSVGTGIVVGAHAALRLARGPYVSLERSEIMPRGSGAPVLTLQGSGKVEIILDRAQGSGALMRSWGLGRGGSHP